MGLLQPLPLPDHCWEQTDGQTKRANRTVEEMLCSYATPYRRNWDEYLVLPNLHTTIAFKQAQGSPLFTSTTTATLIHLCHWSQKSTAHHHVLPTLLPMILLDVPKQTFPVPKMPCIERNSANKNMQIKTADTLNILLETRSYSAQSAFPCTLKRVPPPNCTPNCTPSPPVPSPLSKSFHLWHTNCGCHHTWSVAMYFTSACSSLLNSSLRIFRNASSMPRHLSMLRTTKHYSLWITLRATKPAQLPAMQRQPAILSNGLDTPLGKNTEEPARNIAKGVPDPAPAPAPQPSSSSSPPQQHSLQLVPPADRVSSSDPPRRSSRKPKPRLLRSYAVSSFAYFRQPVLPAYFGSNQYSIRTAGGI
eukprot:1162087-Pelagomonas_calceolata.AAC.2